MSDTVARVAELWRYPVKSMQGERIVSSHVDGRGVLGDRAYAVVDRGSGHVASAKHPRKWTALLACSAAFLEPPQAGAALPPVLIGLPDGSQLRSDDPARDARLSLALGRDVSLVTAVPPGATREADRTPVDGDPHAPVIRTEPIAAAAPGTFFDHAPLHLLSTRTLAQLNTLYPDGRWAVRRFRPNIVLELNGAGDEYGWLGRHLLLGEQLGVYLLDPSPRCVVTTLPQGELPRDPGILRTVAHHSAAVSVTVAPGVLLPGVCGVYAVVSRSGLLQTGDSIEPRIGAN